MLVCDTLIELRLDVYDGGYIWVHPHESFGPVREGVTYVSLTPIKSCTKHPPSTWPHKVYCPMMSLTECLIMITELLVLGTPGIGPWFDGLAGSRTGLKIAVL